MLPTSPFTRSEAFDLGLREREWRALRSDGLLREVVPGYFVDAALPDTLELRLAITRRVIEPDVVVARRTAAWLRGVDVLDYRGFPTTPRIEVVTRSKADRPRNRLMQSHSADDLLESDIGEVGGLRVTTPLRTASDLARFAPRADALVTADAFLHRNLITTEQFEKSLVRWRGRRGVRQAYEIAGMADGRSESGGESRLRLRVLDMGLPRPELQIPVHDLFGNIRFYLDLGWPHWRLALEYDGEEFHGEEQAEHDTWRRSWITKRDWTVRAYRKADIFTTSRHFEDEVQGLVRDVRHAASGWGALGA
jgi:hypothetical protein